MDITNKTFWIDFIDLYKSNTCLWDVKSKDYANKIKRNYSYDILLEKFKELYPEASLEIMKKKINNIRTSFRREFRKVEDSKRTGCGTDDVYEPSLWYYDLLCFIKESETGKQGISNDKEINIETDENDWSHEEIHSPVSITSGIVTQFTNSEEDSGEPSQSPGRYRISTASIKPKIVSRKRSRPTKNNGLEAKMTVYNGAHEFLSIGGNEDDEFDVIGKRFAFQLKKLDDQQRLIAEKLWSDIVFYGAQGKLELDCTIKFPSQNVHQ